MSKRNKHSKKRPVRGGALSKPGAGPGAPPGAGEERKVFAQVREDLSSKAYPSAIEHLRKLLARKPNDVQARLFLAQIEARHGSHDKAKMHAAKVIDISPHPDAYRVIAQVCRSAGETDEAVAACESASALRPEAVEYKIMLAGILEEAGRVSESRGVVDPLVASLESAGKPIPPELKFTIAKLLVHEKDYTRAVGAIDAFASDASSPGQLNRLAFYLKAKAMDRMGEYDQAFEAATVANDMGIAESGIAFNPAVYEDQVTALIENWSAKRVAAFPLAACDDALPVFVAGMPRSGTSLIDQVIDAHPQAAGVGELATLEQFAARLALAYQPEADPPHCFGAVGPSDWTAAAKHYIRDIRRSAPEGAQRVVNKALGNNRMVGLFARLFPKTRIIHAIRDPRDVAVSCYMGGFNNRTYAWTKRLDWSMAAWEQSHRMMEHWKNALDIPILDVHYEELVNNPTQEMPRIIEFLGLEWDDACMDFHKSRRTVRTLSYDQVNRPIYNTSVGRYQNYAAQFENLPAAGARG